MTERAQILTGFLFYAYVEIHQEIHQERRLGFDNITKRVPKMLMHEKKLACFTHCYLGKNVMPCTWHNMTGI